MFGPPYEEGCGPDLSNPVQRAVIVELVNANVGTAESFLARCTFPHLLVPGIYQPSPGAQRSRYLTVAATNIGLAALADTSPGEAGELVARFDLCDFIRSRRIVPNNIRIGNEPPDLTGSSLIGIIDDGCAFAHAAFVEKPVGGLPSTRVAAIWDQDISPIFPSLYGELPGMFMYGRRILREYPGEGPNETSGGAGTIPNGLNKWIRKFWNATTRSIDEDSCYQLAGYGSMRRRAAHGAHVMDVLAGPVPLRSRGYAERASPPTWARAGDAASDSAQSDMVFVQLPRAGLQDTSGGWLDAHVLDAVRCILDWRKGSPIDETVISLSYGSSVGPHDGTSIFGAAIDEILANESTPASTIDIVMAAGNAFGVGGHAVIDLNANQEKTLTWRVLPSSEAPSFVQLWLPCDGAGLRPDVTVSVTPPGAATPAAVLHGDEVQVWYDGVEPGAVVAFLKNSSRGRHAMVLIALAPTFDQQGGVVAAHGDWKVKVAAGAANLGCVHAYIAANEKRIAGHLRGRQSYFVDAKDASRRYLAEPLDDPNTGNAFDNRVQNQALRAQGYVRRRGTLSGISVGQEPRTIAGYRRNFTDNPALATHAPYSSAGKALDPVRPRVPDAAFPTDQSATLRGMRAAGTRSGSTFRMIGTSSAAPQRARALLAGRAPPAFVAPPDADLTGTEGPWPVE